MADVAWDSMMAEMTPEAVTALAQESRHSPADVIACLPESAQRGYLQAPETALERERPAADADGDRWWLVLVPDEGAPQVYNYRKPLNIVKQLVKLDGEPVHAMIFFGKQIRFTREPRMLVINENGLPFSARSMSDMISLADKDPEKLYQNDDFLGDLDEHAMLLPDEDRPVELPPEDPS